MGKSHIDRVSAGALRALPLWLGLAGLASGAYLAVSTAGGGVAGFPLDDAWIHQTYARNLGTAGEWAFLPGHTSAGSTAPLWSLLLAVAYRLNLPPLAWTYGLGIIALGATAWLAAGLAADFFPGRPRVAWLTGLLCVAEWHMVWAAVSGMETALYACLGLAVVRLAYGKHQMANDKRQMPRDEYRVTGQELTFDICHLRFVILGFLGGLLVLTRPEGLVLVGLTALATGWRLRRDGRRLLVGWAALVLGLALPLAPYLAFHYSTTGLPFPNTFYAKQQEYRALLHLYPLWQRWPAMASVTLVGAGVLLVPGFVFAVVRSLKPAGRVDGRDARALANTRGVRWGILLLAAWWLVHLTLYALWLPVTYQHGRYQMPIIPAFVLLGVGGTAGLVDTVRHALFGRVLRRAAVAATGLVCAAFLAVGARAYASDVGFVQGEMVATARWMADNTAADSVLAVHDIGAIGYFAPRRLLDLAGLVTPQVIPFIADEARLMEFMQSQGADYVVFFPDWSAAYGRMARDPRLELVHTTGYTWTREQGRANMAVYRFVSSLQ